MGADERQPDVAGAECVGQQARHGAHTAIERQLAYHEGISDELAVDLAGRHEHAHGDGEVEARSRLAQCARREVHEYPPRGH